MLIYLSGGIDGVDEYGKNFSHAEKVVSEVFPEAEILNPCKFPFAEGRSWLWYVVSCLWIIWNRPVTHIVLLPEWEKSYGAIMELLTCRKKGGIGILDFKEAGYALELKRGIPNATLNLDDRMIEAMRK